MLKRIKKQHFGSVFLSFELSLQLKIEVKARSLPVCCKWQVNNNSNNISSRSINNTKNKENERKNERKERKPATLIQLLQTLPQSYSGPSHVLRPIKLDNDLENKKVDHCKHNIQRILKAMLNPYRNEHSYTHYLIQAL